VHQIELEMQNEELRRAQAELGDTRARYFDLYDLAPVGYVTISEKGFVIEANLTIAGLIGVTRSDLVKQPISRFILPEDQDTYWILFDIKQGTRHIPHGFSPRSALMIFFIRISVHKPSDMRFIVYVIMINRRINCGTIVYELYLG